MSAGGGGSTVVRGTFEAGRSRSWSPRCGIVFEGWCHDGVLSPRIASSLGTAYINTGRVSEGLALLKQADARGASIQFRYGQPLVLTQTRAEASLLAGHQSKAHEAATRALALARESGWLAGARPMPGRSSAALLPLPIRPTGRRPRRTTARP